MNNGKVRIYDLSKELNLDNKDILAICKQLDIKVKSHSSTISDEQAQLITNESKNYIANDRGLGKNSSPNVVNHVQKKDNNTVSKKEKKQQILVVHHRQSQESNSTKEIQTEASPSTPRKDTPALVSPPARPQLKSKPQVNLNPKGSSSDGNGKDNQVKAVAPEEGKVSGVSLQDGNENNQAEVKPEPTPPRT